MIFYFCPDARIKSAGIRILYRHVELLVRHGFPAAILHHRAGFQLADVPNVPVRYLSVAGTLTPGDVVVVPEVWPPILAWLKDYPVRRIGIALNWKFVYQTLPDHEDWRTYRVERILSQSSFIADFLGWAMGLPTHVFEWGVRGDLYYPQPKDTPPEIVYILRKEGDVQELKRVLRSRNRRFVDNIGWRALDGLPEEDYARAIRGASLFLNLSPAEGLPCSLLEAMRAGTLVAGYNSVGGQRELIGGGEGQNCILAENLDYITLAQRMEPLLLDVLAGDLSRWAKVAENGQQMSAAYNLEAEEKSVVSLWRGLMSG